jgi:mannitol/fructose-specific phosphotransferase system IIA component (Ntr-type)/CBS domain-containing protein
MSFRQLLLVENVFDLGDVLVRDVMRPRSVVRSLRLKAPWEENLQVIRESRYSRYPLLDGPEGADAKPLGIVHVKDILFSEPDETDTVDLKAIARPYGTAKETSPLETLLADLQRRRVHQVIVLDAADRWTGIVTMEDVIEEIIGSVEDEFEPEPSLFLGDALSPGRVLLGLKASSIREGIREAVARLPVSELPAPAEKVIAAVEEREARMSTYLGHGVAVPHARLDGIDKACLSFARFDEGIPVPGQEERARFMFILLTPAGNPKIQLRLLARVASLIDSGYVGDRLMEASSAQAVVDAIKAADPVVG